MCAHEDPLQSKLEGKKKGRIKVWAVRAPAERGSEEMNEPAVAARFQGEEAWDLGSSQCRVSG